MVEKSLSSKWNWLFLFHLLEKSVASLTTKTKRGQFFISHWHRLSLAMLSLSSTQEFRDGPTLSWEKPEWHRSQRQQQQLTGWRGASGLGTVPQSWAGRICRASNNASSARREMVDTVEGRRGKSGERKHSSGGVVQKIDDSVSKKKWQFLFLLV